MNPFGDNVGSIEYDARINTSQLKRDSAEADAIAKKTGDNMGSEVEKGETRSSAAFAKFASAAKVAAIAGGVVLAGGIAAAAKASFTQVDAVQQATVALNAYEKDGSKVNNVLKELVGFARSDMGVLFNRKDLFESAQSLKIMGDSTENLTDHVKILSRSVGLGLSNWTDLNLIVGRVGSTGRLTGEDFDNLTKAGYRLDPALRNTNITFDELFKNLDKGIPADAMAGQADTIRGRMVRLQTAFRNVGDAILGVDADSGKFIKGGLGDTFVTGLSTAATSLKGLATSFRDIVPEIQKVVGQIGDYLGPKLSALWNTIKNDVVPAVSSFAKAFGPALGAGLVGFIGLTVDGLNLLLTVATPVLQFLSDNTWIVWGIVGAFVAFKTALAISSAVSAFQTGLAIANAAMVSSAGVATTTTGVMGGLRVALMGLLGPWQIVLAIIGVAAVVAGIKLIADTLESLMEKWAKADKVKVAGGKAEVSSNSDIGLTTRLMNAFSGFRASGGPVRAGQSYIVGENQPELFVPRTSGTIIPEVPSGNSSSNISVTVNMSGIMSRSKSDERDIAKSLIKRVNEELEAMHQRPIGGGAIV